MEGAPPSTDLSLAPTGFVSLTAPQLALGRDGTPRVVPVKIEGLARLLTADQARELAAALQSAAAECEAGNADLLPPLEEYCALYNRRFEVRA